MIKNKKISKFAISIVEELQKNKFQAYLVGGCVRDLMCGITPKDFDIATNATPNEIRKIFKASRIIGKRFKKDVHTVLAAGGINAAFGNIDSEDSWEQHFADTYIEGYGIGDPRIIEKMAKEAFAEARKKLSL